MMSIESSKAINDFCGFLRLDIWLKTEFTRAIMSGGFQDFFANYILANPAHDSELFNSVHKTVRTIVNVTLQKLIEEGSIVNALPISCGDYLCAVDLGNITDDELQLAQKLLHSSDSRLGNAFISENRIIYSLGGINSVAPSVRIAVTPNI